MNVFWNYFVPKPPLRYGSNCHVIIYNLVKIEFDLDKLWFEVPGSFVEVEIV